jgi:hypothetical protein
MLTISVGVASCPTDATTAASLLATADAALYRAKHAGRNQVRVAGEPSEVFYASVAAGQVASPAGASGSVAMGVAVAVDDQLVALGAGAGAGAGPGVAAGVAAGSGSRARAKDKVVT